MPQPSAPQTTGDQRFVTIRSVMISVALMPILALWVVQSELIWYSGHSTAISLFFHVTFVLFVMALINMILRKRWPRLALAPSEMMTIYMMLAVAGTFCSHDLLQIFVPSIAYPVYAANPLNQFETKVLAYLPEWAIVGKNSLQPNSSVLRGLAVGNSSMYQLDVLRAWIEPLSYWFIFLMALMAALTSINIFFRKQWTEKERLSFPIIQIPLMISTDVGSLLRSRLFWIAFGITGGIDLWNGFSYLRPAIPEIPIVEAFRFGEYMVERPWDAIADTTLNIYPFVIGLTFFIPTDLAFSCWFFFIFFKLQLIITSMIGVRDIPGFPFPNEQAAGGYIALGLLAMWISRRHFSGIFRRIFGRPGGADDSDEPISYRMNLIVFIVSSIILVTFTYRLGSAAADPADHVQWWTVPLFFLIFFLYSIAIARMRAELGPPAHDLHAMGPGVLINNAVGSTTPQVGVTEGDRAVFSMFFWFNRAYRAHYSAHSMEGFKIGQQMRLASRAILWAMGIAVVIGALAALWAMLHALYVHGYSGRPAGDAFSAEAWNRMNSWMSFPLRPRPAATAATVIGMAFAVFLGALRMKFTWWLFHPVGYATSTSWSMGKLWFPIFVGWAAKALITRYGGAKAYRAALPFFVGLVMGEFTVGSLWCIYGALAARPVYHFWG